MSVTGISSNVSNYLNETSNLKKRPMPNMQEFKQDFRQLGQDLQAGNLSAAQADFATLQQIGPPGLSNPSLQSTNPLAQAFAQLSQDLQSGDLSAAQQDYAKIQQGVQQQAAQAEKHPHQIQQVLQQLGEALQSGDLSGAQKALAMLKKAAEYLAERGQSTTPSPAAGSVSETA
jgi:predicted helicase